jgi:hypothetical protein
MADRGILERALGTKADRSALASAGIGGHWYFLLGDGYEKKTPPNPPHKGEG